MPEGAFRSLCTPKKRHGCKAACGKRYFQGRFWGKNGRERGRIDIIYWYLIYYIIYILLYKYHINNVIFNGNRRLIPSFPPHLSLFHTSSAPFFRSTEAAPSPTPFAESTLHSHLLIAALQLCSLSGGGGRRVLTETFWSLLWHR